MYLDACLWKWKFNLEYRKKIKIKSTLCIGIDIGPDIIEMAEKNLEKYKIDYNC